MTWVSFDIETSGDLPEYALQPWRVKDKQAWITSYAASTYAEDGSIVSYGEVMPSREWLRRVLTEWVVKKATVVAWNAGFECAWLIAYGLGDLVDKLQWLDGMLLWRHWDVEPEYEMVRHKKRSYGLKECVAEFLPEHAGYEEDVNFHDPSPEARAKLLHYNKEDTEYTLILTKMFYDTLAQEPRRLAAALIEAQCLPVVARPTFDGMVIDTIGAHALQASLEQTAAEALKILAPHGVTETIARSPKQLSNLIFNVWGLPIIKQNTSKLTGNTTDSTDKEVLHELAFIDPRAKVLRTYREALGNQKKFAETPLEACEYNNDGRAHPVARVFSTYTSRMTYSSKQGKNKDERQIGWAIHQEKRGAEFRNILLAPPGYTLCEFDAAGQEFRWMAIASGDETMLSLCAPGEDPHSYMGARVVGADYRDLVRRVHESEKEAKDGRQLGKVANLSLQYRTSAKKLRSVARVQYNIAMEQPQADTIYETYQQTYTGVPKYWKKQIADSKKSGYVETLAGRRVQIKDSFVGPRAWSVASTTINYRIQGTGGDQKYLALAVLRPYMREHGIFFALELHDGLYLYIPDAKVQQCVPEIRKMLLNLPYERAWGFSPPIQLPWDAKTGKSWGGLREWKGE
jgi:DNA polymerase I-like protein with 3'-5' exonuclease and polymerase domains